MVYLIDTNIIVRFLVKDGSDFQKSFKIFKDIENCSIKVIIKSYILMEVYFVLVKFYKLNRLEVISDLKAILSLRCVINDDKDILLQTLSILENKNIDFADALLCAENRLNFIEIISFDKDISNCIKHNIGK